MAHGIETLRERIRGGERVVGASVRMGSSKADLEEMMARRPFDYLAVDGQHGPFNEESLASVCEIANGLGIPIQLRIKHTRLTYLVGNMLDLGPSLIEVPQVEELSTVQEALDYFYYPQKGRRSWGPARSPQTSVYTDRLEYAEWWNSHGVLWMQLETVLGVTRARDMADLGVDVLSWGPNDLRFSREAYPDHPLQTDDDCIEHVLKQLQGQPTKLCLRTYSDDQQARYAEMGVTMFLDEQWLFAGKG